jgi:hypothetical protein
MAVAVNLFAKLKLPGVAGKDILPIVRNKTHPQLTPVSKNLPLPPARAIKPPKA